MAAGLPLSQAVCEYLSWLELDRHGAPLTNHPGQRSILQAGAFVERVSWTATSLLYDEHGKPVPLDVAADQPEPGQ